MLAFAIVLVVVAIIFQHYTLMRGMEGIGYCYMPSASTVEPEEPFELITELTNGTRHFVPFISMLEMLPDQAVVITRGIEVTSGSNDTVYMRSRAYLMPRQRLRRRVRISIPRRGRYFLRGATVNIGDFLGLKESTEYFSQYREIVVVPKPHLCTSTIDLLGGFLGDISVRRFIMEDPVLTLGFREYTMREPLKMISWTQSARRNELMVKKYDYTLEPSVTLLLNVQCDPVDEKEREALIEACFSITRTVCDTLEERGIKYDFYTNAYAAGALSLWSSIGEGLGPRHYMAILEGLGRATYDCSEPFDSVLGKVIRRPRQGRSYIVVTPRREDVGQRGLNSLSALTGGQICVVAAQEVAMWE